MTGSKPRSEADPARRTVLALLVAAGASVATRAHHVWAWRRRRRERALAEADLHRPHDLAG